MMAFLFSSSILILLSLGLPSMVSRDRMGRHPPKGRAGGVFLLARRTLLWCPRKPSVRCALVLRRRGCGLSKGWAGSSLTSPAFVLRLEAHVRATKAHLPLMVPQW